MLFKLLVRIELLGHDRWATLGQKQVYLDRQSLCILKWLMMGKLDDARCCVVYLVHYLDLVLKIHSELSTLLVIHPWKRANQFLWQLRVA